MRRVVDPAFFVIGPDDLVIRGGLMIVEHLRANALDTFEDEGVWELSVYSLAGEPVHAIAEAALLPNGQIRISTVARIREAGYDVLDRRSDGHCRLPLPEGFSDQDLERLADAFDPPIRNPAPRRP